MLKQADACRGGIAVDFALAMRWENVQYFLRVCCGGHFLLRWNCGDNSHTNCGGFPRSKIFVRGGNAESAGIALTVL